MDETYNSQGNSDNGRLYRARNRRSGSGSFSLPRIENGQGPERIG